MSYEIVLRAATSSEWIDAVMAAFDRFLLDHASAERKASAMATSFVVQYPDKFELHIPMIRLAREELLHYQQVTALLHRRNLVWERDEKDPYIRGLMQHLSTDTRLRLLDRLLMGGVVEARGVERFGLVAKHQENAKLRNFYERLSQSEAKHAALFVDLAGHYFNETEIEMRLDRWLDLEADAMQSVPIRPVLH